MITEIQSLLDQYVTWLRDRTALRQVDDFVEITTPYLDRHNNYMQIYAKRDNETFLLTDDGYIIEDLLLSGCGLESKKRQDLLRVTLNGFGVRLEGNALVVRTSADNFPIQKHNLIQAMLAVNDLFYLAAPVVTSLFVEDVTSWLDFNEIRYTPRVKFTGKSGYDHLFDFVIPASRRESKPERILKVINRPNRDEAMSAAFAWIDTREVRPENSRAYAFLNDSEHAVAPAVLDALRNYDVRPLPWSDREKTKPELVS